MRVSSARGPAGAGDLDLGAPPSDWYAALRLLVAGLPEDGPSVVVLDEVPYLIAADPGFEGTLQKIFDREPSRKEMLGLRPAERRMVEAATPLSAKASRETRHTVADPRLRFWPAFLGHRRRVTFVGSVKWKEKRAFDAKDLAELAAHRLRVPGAGEETPMVARMNGGFGLDGWAICGVPSSGGAGCRAVDPESDP